MVLRSRWSVNAFECGACLQPHAPSPCGAVRTTRRTRHMSSPPRRSPTAATRAAPRRSTPPERAIFAAAASTQLPTGSSTTASRPMEHPKGPHGAQTAPPQAADGTAVPPVSTTDSTDSQAAQTSTSAERLRASPRERGLSRDRAGRRRRGRPRGRRSATRRSLRRTRMRREALHWSLPGSAVPHAGQPCCAGGPSRQRRARQEALLSRAGQTSSLQRGPPNSRPMPNE